MIKIWFIAYTHISFPPKWIGCNGWFSFYTQQCSDWLYRPCVRLASSQNRNDVNLLIATRWNRCVQSHAMHIAVLIPVRWNGFLLKVRRNKSIFRHEHFISGARSKTTIPLNENLFLSSFFFSCCCLQLGTILQYKCENIEAHRTESDHELQKLVWNYSDFATLICSSFTTAIFTMCIKITVLRSAWNCFNYTDFD